MADDKNPNGDSRIYDREDYPYRPPALDQTKKKAADQDELKAAEESTVSSTQSGAEHSESTLLPKHEGQIGPGFRQDNEPSFLSRLKNLNNRKKAAIAAALMGAIISLVVGIFSFLPFELLQFKHMVTDKIGGTEAHVYQVGRKKLYSTQFFFDENGQYSGAKVGGIRRLMQENRQTKGMVSALEKNGYKIEFETVNGRQTGKVKSLSKVDDSGKVLASYTSEKSLQSAWSIRQSGDLNGILQEVFPDKSDFWYNRATNKLYRRWGLTRKDIFREKVKEVTGLNKLNRKVLSAEEKVKLALRRTLFGSTTADAHLTGATTQAEKDAITQDKKSTPDQISAASQGLADSTALQDAIDQGQSIKAAMLADPSNNGSNVLGSLLSSKNLGDVFKKFKFSPSDLAGSLNVLNAANNGCTINSSLNAVQNAARTLRAASLMRFSLSVLTVADAVQNGKDVPSDEVSYMMNYLNSNDSNGKNAFASSGWRYWNDPSPANSNFASYDYAQRDAYSVGGGFTGILAEIQTFANNLKAGASCTALHNPFVQALGFAAGITVGFFSAGTSLTVQIGTGIAESVVTSYAISLATNLLAPMVAGTVVNGAEKGTAVGNAFVSGAEVLTSANGASTGMRPLTTKEYKVAEAQVQADQKAELARLPLAQRLFSPKVDQSLTSTAAMGLINFKASNVLASPFASLSKVFSFGGLFGSPALADSANACPDPTIKDHNLAATPFCNLIMGIPDSAMNNPDYAPDKIDDTINATEQNVDDYGNPIKDSSYYKYLQECTADGSPVDGFSGAIDIIHTNENADNPNAYTSRCTNDLFNIYRLYMTIAQGENDALTDSLGSSSAAGSSGSGAPASNGPTQSGSADAQVLAKDILNNSNIDLSGYSSSVLTDVQDAANGQLGTAGAATSSAILQLIDTLGKSHKILVSAIQSNGQGHCNHKPKSDCPTDPHYTGDAVDFGSMDGQSLSGRDSFSQTIINLATSLLPSGSGFGQEGCGGVSISLPSGFRQFPDSCNHLHVEVPAGTP